MLNKSVKESPLPYSNPTKHLLHHLQILEGEILM